jgi:hypothetical protein
MLHLLVATSALVAGKHSSVTQPVLKLRGGVGLDASTAANVGMGLIAANGLYTGLAPGPASEAYGVKDPSFTLQQMIKAVGYTQVAAAVFAFCSLKGVPLPAALAWGQVPWLLLTIDNILNKTPEKMGQPMAGQFLLLAIGLATSYCGFTDTSATNAALFSAAWQALNGVIFALAPGKGAEAWGLAADTKVTLMMKNFGWTLTGGAALVYSVASGTEITKAVGYLFALMMASLVDLTYFSGFFEAMGADKTPAAVWGAIQATVVAATLF